MEAQLSAAGLFEEPLVPTGPTSVTEDSALLQAIDAYHAQPEKDDLGVFETFLRANPHSPWQVALLANMGLLDFHYGYFSRALTAWSQAWAAGRNNADPKVKVLVDRVAGELLLMHARLGHADTIQALLADIGQRKLTGSSTQAMIGTQEGLWMMRHNPGVAYLCGPMALKNLLLTLGRPVAELKFLDDYRTGTHGTSLAEVSHLADTAHLDHQLVYRNADQPVPIPSIVHWKLGHFAAIVGEQRGRYHVQDPTFGHDSWVAAGALNSETSGYYLAVGNRTAKPWRSVGLDEAAKVRGMGMTGMNDPTQTGQYTPTCDNSCTNNATGSSAGQEAGSGSSSYAMTRYSFVEMLASLRLQDKPVGYAPGRGPAVPVTLTYNQAEASQPANFTFFNVSPKWSLNWLAYVQDDPTMLGNNVARIVGGGGSITENFNSSTNTFIPEEPTGATLTFTASPTPTYTLSFPDGSANVYGVSNGAVTYPRLLFISKLIDRYGNTLKFTYDSEFRLTAIVDATSRSTTFTYGNSSFPLQVTQVTDPFGRTATFTYDSTGRLIQITDVLGLTSKYSYDANSLVDSLTTPYGTTNFSYGFLNGNTNSLFLQATDPLGYTERVEYVQNAPYVPFSDPSNTVPIGIVAPFNEYLSDRDTYYWDKHAQAVAPENYLMARQRHWAHLASNTNVTSGVVESVKYPLESRIWFNYVGQPNGGLGTAQSGTLDSPILKGRVLDDGSTQLNQYQYNSLGNPTSTIDPVGRQTTLTYAANNIDLLTVQQKTSVSGFSTIAQLGSYSNHRPQTYTDAAGQTYRYAFNSAGQMISATDPLGHTTQFNYGPLGDLMTIINADGKTAASFTYDAFDRVATRTDSEGWTVSYAYDALDRLTQETFPDQTSRTFKYNKLDLASVTDRQGRTTSATYDAVRNLIAVGDPLNETTRLGYYENRKLKTLTDPNGNLTTWSIDVQGRVTGKTYANNLGTVMAYEATTSRVHAITDALGQSKVFSYGVDNSLAGITYANAVNPTPSVSFTYDPSFRRITSMTDGNGTTGYVYEPPATLGALKLAAENPPFANASIAYQYDALGRMTARSVGGDAETIGYDKIGRVVSHADDLGHFQMTYLGETSQLTSRRSGLVGTVWSYAGNKNDRRLTAIVNSPVASRFQYSTTPENDIIGISEDAGYQVWSYTYDKADRLKAATSSLGESYGYGYDSASNLAQINTPSGVTTVVNNALNQVGTFGTSAFRYDANGNLVSDYAHTYQWDAENRLIGVGYPGVAGQATQIAYDGLSRRTSITDTVAGSSTQTRFGWCFGKLCQARNSANKPTKRYLAEGEVSIGAGPGFYYGIDHLGSVRDSLFATTGLRLALFDYSQYGAPVTSVGIPRGQTDFRYAGFYLHSLSGLYLSTFRAYDPLSGRWLSRDPISESGGINLYGYARSNPLGLVDFYGTCPNWLDQIDNEISAIDKDIENEVSALANSLEKDLSSISETNIIENVPLDIDPSSLWITATGIASSLAEDAGYQYATDNYPGLGLPVIYLPNSSIPITPIDPTSFIRASLDNLQNSANIISQTLQDALRGPQPTNF